VDVLVDLQVATLHVDIELLFASKAECISRLTVLKLERKNSHANEVGSVDSLVGLGDDSTDTLEVGTLGGPVSRGAGTVLFTSKQDSVNTILLVLSSSIEDGHLLTRGDMNCVGTDLFDHLVNESGIGEGTTGHNLIVTSAGAIRVEVLLSDAALSKVASSGRVLRDLTSR